MSKHTPGPWDTDAGHVWSETAKDSKGNSKAICRASRANAALIAAAPELLEAAKLVLCGAAPETLKAAVAKAEGRS